MYKGLFWKKKVQMLPYFEERKSEVAIFRQRVRGGCHNKLRFEKKQLLWCGWPQAKFGSFLLLTKFFWGGGETPSHNVAKEIKILNWKQSLKNNSLNGFFSLFWKNSPRMCNGKIEVTWVTYLTFAFVMTSVTLTLFVRICFFLFVRGSLERFEKLEIFCHHDAFFVQCQPEKEKVVKVMESRGFKGSSDVFWGTVMWAVVLVVTGARTTEKVLLA